MIIHTLLIKLDADHEDPPTRAAVAASARGNLGALEGVRSLEVGLPADEAVEGSWDVAVWLRFDDLSRARAVLEGPAFGRWVAEQLTPRGAFVKGWSFRLG